QDGVSRLTTEVGPGGVRVRTAPDAPVELVLPALSADGATPTSVAVQLDATLDRTTFDLVHGELTIDGNAGLSMGAPGGLSLDVRSLRYDASDGGALTLDVEARVALLDGEPLVLTGGLTATSAGFMGTLSAGAADGALLTVGSDPARLSIRSASLALPERTLSLDGELQVLGSDAACDVSAAELQLGDVIELGVHCAPAGGLPLLATSAEPVLVLECVVGRRTPDPGAGSFVCASSV